MNWRSAILGGLAGGLAMTALVMVLRGIGGTAMNLEMMLGSTLTGRVGAPTWFLGLALHLMFSVFFGLIYGTLMEAADRRGASVGLMFGSLHTILSGLLLPIMASAHPLVRTGEMLPPGVFAANLGAFEGVLFVALHLIYGATVGVLYELRTLPLEEEMPVPIPERRPPTEVRGVRP